MVDWNAEIADPLRDAWEELRVRQIKLFERNNNEESVSGAFAALLEPLCSGDLVITTEHNKMNDLIRTNADKAIMLGQDVDEVKPDIVIHVPEENSIERNLLVIEMKKYGNSEWRHDEDKLLEMTSPPRAPRHFQYRFGLLIRYRETGEIGVATLFQGGEDFYLNPANFRRN